MTESTPKAGCQVCGAALTFKLATSRKAKIKKVFVMVVCPTDGRHFRGFISDQGYVGRLVDRLGSSGTGTGVG